MQSISKKGLRKSLSCYFALPIFYIDFVEFYFITILHCCLSGTDDNTILNYSHLYSLYYL